MHIAAVTNEDPIRLFFSLHIYRSWPISVHCSLSSYLCLHTLSCTAHTQAHHFRPSYSFAVRNHEVNAISLASATRVSSQPCQREAIIIILIISNKMRYKGGDMLQIQLQHCGINVVGRLKTGRPHRHQDRGSLTSSGGKLITLFPTSLH